MNPLIAFSRGGWFSGRYVGGRKIAAIAATVMNDAEMRIGIALSTSSKYPNVRFPKIAPVFSIAKKTPNEVALKKNDKNYASRLNINHPPTQHTVMCTSGAMRLRSIAN